MKCYIELWNTKEAWNNLSKQEKADFLSQQGPTIQNLMEKGVEVVNWGINDSSTAHRANYDFFAIWNFPNQEVVKEFEDILEAAGWYNYFEQVNISGEPTSPDVIMGKLMES